MYTLTLKFCVVCIVVVNVCIVVVNVMVSLISVMSPPPALCNLSVRTVVWRCSLVVFSLGLSLVSLIVMISACVSWISSLSSSSLFLIPFMLTCSMMRLLSLLLLGLCHLLCLWSCGRLWSVCEVVVVPYVDAVVVMCVLLFELHVCLLRECDGVRLTAMLGAGRFNTICTAVGDRCDRYTACRLCRLEPLYIVWTCLFNNKIIPKFI